MMRCCRWQMLWLLTFVASITVAQPSPRWEVGDPIVHQNLAVFPVRFVGQIRTGDYMLLKEAQQKQLVKVTELPEGATVPYVLVENKGKRPLLLLGGEVILGGKQDRLVEHDTIVPPKTTMKVKVYCVEPGRWTPMKEGEQFIAPNAMASGDVRKAAQVRKEQTMVWSENERLQRQLPALSPSPSKSYRQVLTSPQVLKEVEAYIRAIQAQLQRDERACGVIVAINGRIEWLDVFGDPKLFRKALPALLHSAAVQALAKKPSGQIPKPPSVAEAKKFLLELHRGQGKLERATQWQELKRVETPSAIFFEAKDKQPVPASVATIHIQGYRK